VDYAVVSHDGNHQIELCQECLFDDVATIDNDGIVTLDQYDGVYELSEIE
jgi:hypothetical protein